MKTFDGILEALRQGRYRVTDHAADEMADDGISEQDLLDATKSGEVIEDYPNAFPFPACLVLAHVAGDPSVPLHAVWAFDETPCYAVLVTAYRPDPDRWSADFRTRGRP